MSAPRVAVIGAGTMGHGIAYVAALAGCEVRLTDSRADAVPLALDRITGLLAGAVQRGKLTADERAAVARRVRGDAALGLAVAQAGVVIEAVVEELAVKQALFREVEQAAPRDALLATNTSSLSIAAKSNRRPVRMAAITSRQYAAASSTLRGGMNPIDAPLSTASMRRSAS